LSSERQNLHENSYRSNKIVNTNLQDKFNNFDLLRKEANKSGSRNHSTESITSKKDDYNTKKSYQSMNKSINNNSSSNYKNLTN